MVFFRGPREIAGAAHLRIALRRRPMLPTEGSVVSSSRARLDVGAATDPSPWIARSAALLVGVAVLLLLSLMLWGLGRRSAGTVGDAPIRVRAAPDFTLPLFGGGSFNLAEARGKPVLVNFWASWCVPCEDEAPVLERASREYADRLSLIGVNVQDTEPSARAFLRRYGMTYPNGRDESGAIAVDFGMSGVPESYFIDRQGGLMRKWQGPLDESRLRAFLDELIAR